MEGNAPPGGASNPHERSPSQLNQMRERPTRSEAAAGPAEVYLEREVDLGEEVERVIGEEGEQRVERRLGAGRRHPPHQIHRRLHGSSCPPSSNSRRSLPPRFFSSSCCAGAAAGYGVVVVVSPRSVPLLSS